MSFSPQVNTRRWVKRTIEATQEKTGAARKLLQQFRFRLGLPVIQPRYPAAALFGSVDLSFKSL
jgi:hypothetical protein